MLRELREERPDDKFLPRSFVRKTNGRVADRFQEEGKLLLCGQYRPEYLAKTLVAKELDSGVVISEDEYAEEMEEMMIEIGN